jgi:hypothetical protein
VKKNNRTDQFFVLRVFKGLTSVFLLFVLALMSVHGTTHRYHTSLTQIDYNEKEKLAEITIQLFTHDLVPTLEREAKKKIDLEKTPDVDKLILEYLNKKFVLKGSDDQEKKLNWVGKELEVDVVFVFVETALPEGLSGIRLLNTIFFEDYPEQTNLVAVRSAGKKSDLLFVIGDKFKEIFPLGRKF